MNKYNEELLNASKKISQDTLEKSAQTVKKLTHPSSKATHIGSLIGVVIGGGLMCGGLVGAVLGKNIIGVGGLAAGAVTIVSNILNLKKK